MSKNLVIVESPAKAKTIEKFLGEDYKVVSSYGHISDLPSKELGVDVENNFKPKYIISKEKKEIVMPSMGLVFYAISDGLEGGYLEIANSPDRENVDPSRRRCQRAK